MFGIRLCLPYDVSVTAPFLATPFEVPAVGGTIPRLFDSFRPLRHQYRDGVLGAIAIP
jgi:hypothetical protein